MSAQSVRAMSVRKMGGGNTQTVSNWDRHIEKIYNAPKPEEF